MNKNAEGYPDPTASTAISRASKAPDKIKDMRKVMDTLADIMGYEIVGRIVFRDMKTGKEYR